MSERCSATASSAVGTSPKDLADLASGVRDIGLPIVSMSAVSVLLCRVKPAADVTT
jgi:hypothetical protein